MVAKLTNPVLVIASFLTFFASASVLAEPDCWPCFSVSPSTIDYPVYGKPGIPVEIPYTMTNASSFSIFRREVNVRLDSTIPAGLTGAWISPITPPIALGAGGSEDKSLILNPDGTFQDPGTVFFGRVIFIYGDPVQSDTIHIRFLIADTVVFPRADTISTSCLSLMVSTDGNMGRYGVGGVNMNFSPVGDGGVECDTSLQSGRGDSRVYLYDGSPIILRQDAGRLQASWSLFGSGFSSNLGLRPITGQAVDTAVSMAGWDEFHSGTFVTADSLLKIEKVWYAPRGEPDDCRYIIQQIRVFSAMEGVSVPGLTIGELVDWNVPTDTTGNYNVGGYDSEHSLVWMRGYDILDGAQECAFNSRRYAGVATLYIHLSDSYSVTDEPYAAYTAKNIDMLYSGSLSAEKLWDKMQTSGYSAEPDAGDLHTALVFKNAPATGWTLPANDTLFVWTAIAATYQADDGAAGLDSLRMLVDQAKAFASDNLNNGRICCCCGTATRGNLNGVGLVDLSDLAYLISYLTADGPRPSLTSCSANIDGRGIIDLTDLALLVSYLIGKPPAPLPPCL